VELDKGQVDNHEEMGDGVRRGYEKFWHMWRGRTMSGSCGKGESIGNWQRLVHSESHSKQSLYVVCFVIDNVILVCIQVK